MKFGLEHRPLVVEVLSNIRNANEVPKPRHGQLRPLTELELQLIHSCRDGVGGTQGQSSPKTCEYCNGCIGNRKGRDKRVAQLQWVAAADCLAFVGDGKTLVS